MNKRAIIISTLSLGLILLQSCRGKALGTPDIPPTPTITETPAITTEGQSVVLISWDGSRADIVYNLMDEGLLPTFSSLAAQGMRAEYVQSIDPSLIAAAHNSISSGSYPTRTGITSNSYHVTGDDFYWYSRGYDEPMDNAEPIWVTASKAGLITAAVFFIVGTPALTSQTADYTIGYGIEDAYSKLGDHGMSPIHINVFLNTVLGEAGLLTLDSHNNVVLGQTKAFAITSSGAVYVYINLMGRESGGGTVSADDYSAVQAQIIALLSDLVDPNSGQPVFQRVLLRSELASLGLDHPNSRDVFAQVNPGYHLDGWRRIDYVFSPTDFYSQHGYNSSLPEMHTIFIAAGYGVPLSNAIIPPLKIVDYAPTIALLLGFTPADTLDGSIIPAFIQP